jgi:1,4-alpha-glucan branching enzyme
MVYAFTENFCLPLSHDEVVHGKGSLLGKMPGDDWQKLANLRLLYAYMYGPAGQEAPLHGRRDRPGPGVEPRRQPGLAPPGAREPLYRSWGRGPPGGGPESPVPAPSRPSTRATARPEGFEWLEADDAEASVLAFLRKGKTTGDLVACVLNFTPVVRTNYRLGVPRGGRWEEVLNTDAEHYWGSGVGNLGGVEAAPVPAHGRRYSLTLTLPPLGAVFLKSEAPSG